MNATEIDPPGQNLATIGMLGAGYGLWCLGKLWWVRACTGWEDGGWIVATAQDPFFVTNSYY